MPSSGASNEGKGLIAGHIGKDYGHHIRVGAANAGHTVYTEQRDGADRMSRPYWEKHVMQQIPCGAYVNPEALLYVGPGALISPGIFRRELSTLLEWRRAHGHRTPYVYVDQRAHVITADQIMDEAGSGLDARIGSTSTIAREGIGQAQADRVMRSVRCVEADAYYAASRDVNDELVILTDVPAMLHQAGYDLGGSAARRVLLEGTQGTGLSLTTGQFPYVTSRNTTVAGLCADAGVAPGRVDRVILVARTYPIRVAGPSGPFYPDSREINWNMLGVNPENERTTVTKKVRRVATLSIQQVVDACVLNGATEIALTFCDYVQPSIAGAVGSTTLGELVDVYPELGRWIEQIERGTGVKVTMLGAGPHSVIDLK